MHDARLAVESNLPLGAVLPDTVVTMVNGGRDEESGEYPEQVSTPIRHRRRFSMVHAPKTIEILMTERVTWQRQRPAQQPQRP
jgi:hypothetical protein